MIKEAQLNAEKSETLRKLVTGVTGFFQNFKSPTDKKCAQERAAKLMTEWGVPVAVAGKCNDYDSAIRLMCAAKVMTE